MTAAPHLVRLVDPAGDAAFLCYDAPGMTPDRDAGTRFTSRAVAVRAADILTWTEEPELLQRDGQPVPVFTAADIAAARLYSEAVRMRIESSAAGRGLGAGA